MKLMLEFTLPEERVDAELAQAGGKLLSAIEEFDGLLRSRIKYGNWTGALKEAEEQGVVELLTVLRSRLSELKAEALSVGE